MKNLRQLTGATPFFLAVFLNAFVDLGHKITIQNTVFKLHDGPGQVILVAIVNGLILLPFILLLSPAGFLSDKYRKTDVMRLSAWLALALTLAITLFYYLGWFWSAFAMTFLLAAQSAVYSPAKYGYIRELFGKERLSEANGVVSALSICAILAGIFVFSMLFETRYPADATNSGEVLRAVAPLGWMLVLSAAIELVMMYRLPVQRATGVREAFAYKRYFTGRLFREDLQPLVRQRVIRLSVVGLATFWGVGQVMLAAFPAFIKEEMGISNAMVVQGVLACSGLGIALGSVFAGRVSRNYIETGLLPLGALGVALGLLVLPNVESSAAAALAFLLVGFMGGIFIVPLNALIQFHAGEQELGRTLAANNWFQNVVMLGFLLLTVAFAVYGLSSKTLLQLIAFVALAGCCYTLCQLPQSFARLLLTLLLSRRYRIAVQGMKNVPSKGGVLLLGNHLSWLDWAIVQIACPRPVRFVMIRSVYERWYLKWIFNLFGCIPIEQGSRSQIALAQVAEALMAGEVVCLFPEGVISRTGHLAEFRKGFERACAEVDDSVVILPFYLRGLWGSQFSRASAHLKAGASHLNRRDLIVAFGKALPKTTTADVLKRRVLELSITAWQAHAAQLPALPVTWIQTVKRQGSRLALLDADGKGVSAQAALAVASAMARRIRRRSPEQNVAVLLPSSSEGMLSNMAVLVAGKTLVNLDYTASRESLESILEQADIRSLYTSCHFLDRLRSRGVDLHKVLEKLQVIEIESVYRRVSAAEKLWRLAMIKLLPAKLLQLAFCRVRGGEQSAAIVFSRNEDRGPRGVCLSHNNIHANVAQIAQVLNTEGDDIVLANLPLFNAFGLTVTQFLPLLEGIPIVWQADTDDLPGCAKAIARHQVTLLFASTRLLHDLARSSDIHPFMFDSLRLVVAGGEKLDEQTRREFKLKFGKEVYEGYGTRETTPVVSVNLPDKLDTVHWQVQLGHKAGSVGMPLPGSSCKVVDPETFEELQCGEAGMLVIGGVQVMQGYLKHPEETAKVIREIDGVRWYISGDKGYMDADGFLYIVGRYPQVTKNDDEAVAFRKPKQVPA